MRALKSAAFLTLLSFCGSAFALGALDQSTQHFASSASSVFTTLGPAAVKTLLAAFSLQLIFNLFKDLMNSNEVDLGKLVSMLVTSITWVSAAFWLINHQALFVKFFSGYIQLAANFAGVSASAFTPSALMDLCWKTTAAIHSAALTAFGNSPLDFLTNSLIFVWLLIVDVVVVVCFFILSLSLFISIVEFSLMLAVAPLQFALLPFNSLRNQGLAPLKGFMSVGIRVMILGLIVAAMNSAVDALVTDLSAGQVLNAGTPDIQQSLFSAMSGLIACAAMAFSAGKIASSIASGSANFSGNDALAAGAKMGALMASGGGAAAAGLAGAWKVAGGAEASKKIAAAARGAGDMKISNPMQNAASGASGASKPADGVANMFSSGGDNTMSKPYTGTEMPAARPSLAEFHGQADDAARYEQMQNPTSEAPAASGGSGGNPQQMATAETNAGANATQQAPKPIPDQGYYKPPGAVSQMASSLDKGINALQGQDSATSVQVDVR